MEEEEIKCKFKKGDIVTPDYSLLGAEAEERGFFKKMEVVQVAPPGYPINFNETNNSNETIVITKWNNQFWHFLEEELILDQQE